MKKSFTIGRLKIAKIKLKLPREPFKDLFEEIDIQNKNCFDKEIVILEAIILEKTHAKEFMCNAARSRKNESP